MHKIMRNVLVMAVTGALSVACAVQPKPSPTASQPATPQQVHDLMKVAGVAQLMQSTMNQMSSQFTTMMHSDFPCVPSDYWSHFMGPDAQQEILDRMVPIYQKHFTQGDVTQMLTFYRTPLGQKVIHEMPAVMHDAMKVGQQWGRSHAVKMMRELRADGVLDAQGKCEATPPPHPPKLSGG